MKTLPRIRGVVGCLAFASVFTFSQKAISATLINWGGDYVTASQSLVGSSTTSPGVTTYLYSSSTAKSPSSTAGYTGPEFYGAFSLTNTSGTGTPAFSSGRYNVANSGTNDVIQFGTAAPTADTVTMRGLVFFEKAEFLNGGAIGAVTLDGTSSFSLNVTALAGTTRQAQIAVYALSGGVWSWYLSSQKVTGVNMLSLTDAGDALWALYSIDNTTSPLNAPPTSYTVAGSSFADIGAVGYFFNVTGANGANITTYANSFTFNGAVTAPEPSSASMAALGTIGLVCFYRFHLRKRSQLVD